MTRTGTTEVLVCPQCYLQQGAQVILSSQRKAYRLEEEKSVSHIALLDEEGDVEVYNTCTSYKSMPRCHRKEQNYNRKIIIG